MYKINVSIAALLLAGFSTAVFCQAARRSETYARPAATRTERSLNANWRFSPRDDKDSERRDFDDSAWQRVNVPHTWNNKDAFDEMPGYRRGASWYRRDLPIGREFAGKSLWLYFEGSNQVTEVYINGRLIGRHIGGYTAFNFDITDAVDIGKTNLLAVRVDNGFNTDIPPLTADFNMYGGIYRDVRLNAADKLHFKIDDLASSGIQISTPVLSAASGRVLIRGQVSNKTGRARNIDIESRVIDPANRTIAIAAATLSVPADAESAFENSTRPIAHPRLWSPDDPYLYTVETIIRENGRIVDSVSEPLGFRWFKFDADNGFFLNGKPLKLRGTNRHQDYKGLGNALSNRLHVRDMELIKDTGFNFVRLAHYPQDPAVLRAADRLGILLWEEIPIVNYITDSKAFADNSAVMLREMIRQHRNHPSVIMWGYMNEIFLRVPK
ncbi:MAG TPA: glycoside hydrolase family 2 TIM barrel-domain containing protein, partial [Pyrinomonadaceae bacterium]|nr:glycoside hydrolase family 2 TIM barrel-domain containing protein [Pyrinomonadaceae bacterium]